MRWWVKGQSQFRSAYYFYTTLRTNRPSWNNQYLGHQYWVRIWVYGPVCALASTQPSAATNSQHLSVLSLVHWDVSRKYTAGLPKLFPLESQNWNLIMSRGQKQTLIVLNYFVKMQTFSLRILRIWRAFLPQIK